MIEKLSNRIRRAFMWYDNDDPNFSYIWKETEVLENKLEKAKTLSEEEVPSHPHAYRDTATDWDDMCEDISWYQQHLEKIREVLK